MIPKETYKHTQTGWYILVTYGIITLILILWEGTSHSIAFVIPIFVILFVFFILFPSLTVTVDDNSIQIRFGLGLIRKKFKLEDIKSCTVVRNRWWYGWGIRWMPKGWLFNIWGFDAVELLMNNGKVYRIGTDEPQKLNEFIQKKLIKGK